MATKKGDIFTIFLTETLVPTADITRRLFIERPQRKISVKRILIDVNILDITTGLFVSWEQNKYVKTLFSLLGESGADMITSLFLPIGFVPLIIPGHRIYLNTPGQFYFDNLYIKNIAEINLNFTNLVGLSTFLVSYSLTVETEQTIIY